ncbi:MAG: TldD/PmbA family protein [Firmicutes bacterium]|nr:TldD/PmbA family protein [Bacillota bacterium]
MDILRVKELLLQAAENPDLSFDDWEITQEMRRGWEFYFIRHQLDQNRAKQVRAINLKLYKKSGDGQFLGSASMEIDPTASDEEVMQVIRDLIYRASLVKNPVYSLVSGDGKAHQSFKMVSLEAISDGFIRALQDVQETETEDVNSYEIFVSEISRHYINSQGADYLTVYPSSMLEVVVNARDREKAHEIELYRMLTGGSCDRDHVISVIEKAMQYGKDKLICEPTPAIGQAPVILSGDNALEVYRYFLMQMNVSAKYQQISRAEIGKPLQEGIEGDRITLRAVRELPNASHNFTVDEEGSSIQEKVLMEDGIVRAFYGKRQFAQYLGIDECSNVYNYVVEPGTASETALRTGAYLEAVEFSDFQVDPMTGDIAGEIRLGYLHDGDTTRIVSGGSISGSMNEAMKHMHLSSEKTLYDGADVPSLIRFDSLTVTGIS